MSEKNYGHTETGQPITDELIDRLAAEAERGDEPGQLQARPRGRGRPPLGASAKSVESIASGNPPCVPLRHSGLTTTESPFPRWCAERSGSTCTPRHASHH